MHYQEYALIVAGGKGTRMQHATSKQFIEIKGLPVLMHTLLAFYRYRPDIPVVLVLPENEIETWELLCRKYNFHKPVILQGGGNTRFQSVKNGLQKIEGDGLVAIHDGVRPLVSTAIIRASFEQSAQHGAAIASVPLKESIRRMEDGSSHALDRSHYRLIQTPQTFNVALIQASYQQPEYPHLTDDASVAENAGHPITLFDGSYENINITTEEDLVIVEALMNRQEPA
jgi:2-C-methyl-D-erythritol 4-phosphate cytidylyltransferase